MRFPVYFFSGALIISFLSAVLHFIGSMSIYRGAIFYFKGLREFTQSGFETASKNFKPNDLEVDCSMKNYVITGANSGLGFSTALALAKRNGTVHLICRNEKSGKEAREKIIKESKNQNVHLHIVDISKPNEITKFVKAFSKSNSKLDGLINNAGVLLNERIRTEDDLEQTFATNTLGSYVMTKELMGLLSKSDDPRVIIVSSGGMYKEKLDSEDFNFDRWTKYNGIMAYCQTKRQQVVMAEEFAKTYPSIFFASMHPGWADTPGVKSSIPSFYEIHKSKLRTSEEGADTIVWLAIAPVVKKKHSSGQFFLDRSPTNTHLPLAWTKSTEEENAKFMQRLESVAEKVFYSS